MSELFGPITPALVLAMIPGIAQFFKEVLALDGKKAQILVMAVTLILAAGLQLRELYIVINPWFELGIYAVLFWLTASGYYKLMRSFTAARSQ